MEFKERRGEIRQGRVVGLVIAVTMLIWISAQSLGLIWDFQDGMLCL